MGKKTKKFLILTGYFKDESYGLLGPQMAATLISDNTDYDCIVAAVTSENDKKELRAALNSYFEGQKKLVGFSSLGGRPDLFEFAKELKNEGAVTLLAGPQAGPDYKGEIGWESRSHRFKGLSDHFSFALQGPAQAILPILKKGIDTDISGFAGVVIKDETGRIIENLAPSWEDAFLSKVDWKTLHILKAGAFVPLTITTAQVLQQIGCPHAAREKEIFIDYPFALQKKGEPPLFQKIYHKGCSFCDVAVDKGYMGAIGVAAVREQLICLPQGPDGRKIPFELINENPLFKLGDIFRLAEELAIELSQINLTLRADFLLKGLTRLEEVLETAKQKEVRILLSSIGFESFDDTVLKNLNKGVDRNTNLEAIKAVRSLKSKYPAHLGYLKEEGANHGFIHPTPWDNPEISRQINQTIAMYQLSLDILPYHSTPLIIHHASGLADWIRRIEEKEKIEFQRVGTTIGWWRTNIGSLV